jgi:hypothetical protein
LLIQVAWHVVHVVLEQSGIDTRGARVFTMSFAVTVATDLVIAAAAVNLAPRVVGARRVGARIASVAYFVMVASVVVREVVLLRAGDNSAAHAWLMAMRRTARFAFDGALPRARIV